MASNSNKQCVVQLDTTPIKCRACEARHQGICGVLSPDELGKLSKAASLRKLEAGSSLASEGEDTPHYASIVHGVVKLSKTLADGRQQLVGLQFAPDFLGRPYQKEGRVNAEAASDITLCVFPQSTFESLIGASPELEGRLYIQALTELDDARDWMLTLGRKSAREKVASFLCFVADHSENLASDMHSKSRTFVMPLTRADTADFLGLTIETVSRQLTHMRKSSVISIENNRIVSVPNMDELRGVADQS